MYIGQLLLCYNIKLAVEFIYTDSKCKTTFGTYIDYILQYDTYARTVLDSLA